MRINVEIDVGLHRGGIATMADLDEALDTIASSGGALVFSGFMGYDVHAGSAPAIFSGKEKAIRSAFDETMERYRAFYDHARAEASRRSSGARSPSTAAGATPTAFSTATGR